MAWDHNARNRSAEVRRVNYHEDEPNKRSSSSSGGNGGGLGPLGKVILGGVAIYIAGSIGLGWVTDAIDNAKTAIEIKNEIKEVEKMDKADDKKSEKAEKKLEGEINSQGYTEKFDIDNIELESGDVADIIEKVQETYFPGNDISSLESAMNNIVYLDNEAFENSANYKAAVIDRLHLYDGPVAFTTVYYGLSEKKMDKQYEHVDYIRSSNLPPVTDTCDTVYLHGITKNESLIIIVAFYKDEQ